MSSLESINFDFISLTQDVKLPDQSSVCSDSEMTPPSSTSCSSIASNDTPDSKSSMELLKEITFLETQILHLECHILSLYCTAFQQHVTSLLTETPPSECKVESLAHPVPDKSLLKNANTDALLSGHHAQLSNHQSVPNLSPRKKRGTSHSLGDHLGTSCRDTSLLDRPDRLSEDILRCICSIYCKLGDQNLSQSQSSISSASSMFSSGTNFTKNLSDTSNSYAEMVEILKINPDDDSFNYAAGMLKKFRTLVKKLENIDPQKMKREQKLVFWINIHNALVMHAYLAYGTHNNTKSNSILKATYNIGGHSINAYTIQISILRIESHFRASWLQSLLSPGRKSKTEQTKHIYAIEYPEPLVHFALSLGAFSDPAVRIYNADNIFQDLRLAKQDFIQSTVFMNRETRIYLPKILYYFAKDMAMSMSSLLETVNVCLSETQQKVMKTSIKDKPEKYVYWLSQSCIFRYVIQRDTSEGRLSL